MYVKPGNIVPTGTARFIIPYRFPVYVYIGKEVMKRAVENK